VIADPHRREVSLLRWAQQAAAAISSRDEKLEVMSRAPLFSNVGRRGLTDLGSIFELSFVHPGEMLQRRGTRCRWWTIVVEGTALAFDAEDPVGLPQRWVTLLNPGDTWDQASIVRDEPCQVSITALTPMVLLIADARNYQWLVEHYQALSSGPGAATPAPHGDRKESTSRAQTRPRSRQSPAVDEDSAPVKVSRS